LQYLLKFIRKEGFSMKKMLAKAVVLGLVLGGIGFVANDAQAAEITDGVKVFSGVDVVLAMM
jgi:Na+/melibiose symporter-like transporter